MPLVVDIDDLMTETGSSVADIDDAALREVTEYALRPANAAAEAKPWTRAAVRPGHARPPRHEDGVEVTASGAGPPCPTPSSKRRCCRRRAFFKRRDAPFGVAGSPELGSELRLLAKVDPDVAVVLGPVQALVGRGMNLGDVMQEVADRLDTIDGLRVFAYPPDQPPPAPRRDRHLPGLVHVRRDVRPRHGPHGCCPSWLLVGKVSDRAARDQITDYLDGSGADSVKAVIESGTYTAFDTVRVMSVEFDRHPRRQASTTSPPRFTLDIAGQGA